MQALNDSDIHQPSSVCLPAADLPDRFRRQIQEYCQSLVPLIEQLLPMNHNQGVDPALRDQPCGDSGLSERCRRTEGSFVMLDNLGNGFQLERPYFAVELCFDWSARKSLVAHFCADPMGFKQIDYLHEAGRGFAEGRAHDPEMG